MTIDRGGIRGIDVNEGDSERALEELRAAGATRSPDRAGLRVDVPLVPPGGRRLRGRAGARARRRARGRGAGGAGARGGERRAVPRAPTGSRPPTTRWPAPTARSARSGPSGSGQATTRPPRCSSSRGHELDAQPWAMARRLDGVERPPADALADWTADGSLADVGRDQRPLLHVRHRLVLARAASAAGRRRARLRRARRRRRCARGLPARPRPRGQQRDPGGGGGARGARPGHHEQAARPRARRRRRARQRDLHADRHAGSATRSTSAPGSSRLERVSMWERSPAASSG